MKELLGMVMQKVYYRYVGEHRQRQIHLVESRAVMTLNHVGEEGEGERGSKCISQEAKCTGGAQEVT